MNVCVLVNIIKETDRNWRFIFEDPLQELRYLPGQLVQLIAKPGEEGSFARNYSIASWPNGLDSCILILK